MCSLSKEQSILSRETVQNVFFFHIPFLTLTFYHLSITPQPSTSTRMWYSSVNLKLKRLVVTFKCFWIWKNLENKTKNILKNGWWLSTRTLVPALTAWKFVSGYLATSFFTKWQNVRLVRIQSICKVNLNVAKTAKFFSDRVENIVEREKMLVTIIFSFIHKVLRNSLSQAC